jgi:hypothetical protein
MTLENPDPESTLEPLPAESDWSLRHLLPKVAWLPLVLIVLLVPWAWVKVLGFFGLLLAAGNVRSLSRAQTAAVLGTLFAVAYLFSPYWLIPVDAKRHAFGPVAPALVIEVIGACALFVAGALWAWASSGAVSSEGNNETNGYRWLIAPGVLAIIVLAANFAPLYYSVPVQGDEDWHFWRAINLRLGLAPMLGGWNLAYTLAGVTIVAGVLAFVKRPAIHIRVLIVVAALTALAVWQGFLSQKGMTYLILRYPMVSTWAHVASLLWSSSVFDEGAYRIVPLVSVFAIGCFAMWAVRRSGANVASAVLIGAAVITVPNLYYHSTALYLEMPAVALLTVTCFFIERLLRDDPDSVRTCPGWYTLLAAGFIKETMAAVLIVFIIMRLGVRGSIIRKQGTVRGQAIVAETITAICAVLPVGIYLFVRAFFGDVRGYSFHWANLGNIQLYAWSAKALWQQYGLLLPVAFAGLVMAWRLERRLFAAGLICIFFADFLFHFLDVPQFVGMARFDLVLFAPLMALGLPVLQKLSVWSNVSTGLAIVWLAANILMSPVAPGGERAPYWLSRDKMSCDFYFPKADAIKWLKENRTGVPFLVGGAYADPKLGWYCRKFDYPVAMATMTAEPRLSDAENLRGTVQAAESEGAPLLLYFRMTPGTDLELWERSVRNYRVVKEFRNRYLVLVLYEQQPASR